MSRKKPTLPFDRRGGVIATQRRLLDSPQYLLLSAQAKVLMTLMHVHWRPDQPVAYGIREASAKIPCARSTAMAAFTQLANCRFIVMVDESYFDSRTTSKSRTWRLTWLPYNGKDPTNDWEKIDGTGSKQVPVHASQVSDLDRLGKIKGSQVSKVIPQTPILTDHRYQN